MKYSTLNTEFSTQPDVKKPWLNDDKGFYIIYSQKKIRLDQERVLCWI